MNKDLESYTWTIVPECPSLDDMIEVMCMQDGFDQEDDYWEYERIWSDTHE
jgi:hypothetical protein